MKRFDNVQQTQQSSIPARHSASAPTSMPSSSTTVRMPGWILLPLRLFLGITFIYAGIQKLTDPQFFHRSTSGYIGNQIIAFAHGSPLHDILMHYAVPHAVLFGLVVAFGEIAIGLGTLVGFLFRPATFFGFVLSVLFFLTASWHVYPYFYGSDIVFAFCWLTLVLNGPLNTGLPSIDAWLARTFLEDASLEQQAFLTPAFNFLLAMPGTKRQRQTQPAALPAGETQPNFYTSQRASPRGTYQIRQNLTQRTRETRRSFLLGVVTGGASMLILGAAALAPRVLGRGSDDRSASHAAASTTAPAATQGTGDNGGNGLSATPAAGTPGASGGQTIAQVSAVPKNNAVNFTIPSSGDPGVLIHLPNDQFIAYDATCTHAGCQVAYDQGSQHLLCPCHGAEFDPAQGAAVLAGPTNTPLSPVSIHIDSATGAVTLA